MSKLSNPRRHRRSLLVEPLENRQLMSLTVDLRLPGGAKTANVSSVGQKISLEVWATVNDANTSSTDDGLQSAQGSLLSTNVSGGAAKGSLDFTPLAPWNDLGSHDGKTQDLDGDGDSDVGSNDNSIDTSFIMARAGSLQHGDSFKLGTATFTVTSLLSTTGQTNLVFRGRNALAASVWLQDGKPMRPASDGSGFNDGTPLVIKRGGTASGATISGTVFNDADKDNVFDASESGLGNVKVFIDTDKDGVLDTGEKVATTDSSGAYFFTGLSASTYRVRQQAAPTGFNITSPSTKYFDVTVTTNQTVTGKNFANQPTGTTTGGASISGTVFSDDDKDGVLDTADPKLANKKMFIDADKDGVLDTGEKTVLSNASGVFTFTGLAAGTYRIRRADLPTGYKYSTPTAGYYDVTVTTNQVVTGKNFGAVPNTTTTTGSTISGTVFSDADKDGILDTTDTKLANKKMFIDTDKDGILDTGEKVVYSNASGVFSFTGLAAGTYRIRRADLPTGYKYSTPSAGYYDVVIGTNATITGKNFGAIPV